MMKIEQLTNKQIAALEELRHDVSIEVGMTDVLFDVHPLPIGGWIIWVNYIDQVTFIIDQDGEITRLD
ncbi:MAG: hypothetical protein HQL75_00385 [Magnetococcales bacterium]|nr:hypothetical protein [Magnetococcales bacterium]